MTKLEIALSYLKKGLSVVPLYGPEMLKDKPPQNFLEELKREIQKNEQTESSLPKEKVIEQVLTRWCKKPCIIGWKEYQDRLPSREEVTHWFTMNPTANLAIITGAISGLVVFPFKNKEEFSNEK